MFLNDDERQYEYILEQRRRKEAGRRMAGLDLPKIPTEPKEEKNENNND